MEPIQANRGLEHGATILAAAGKGSALRAGPGPIAQPVAPGAIIDSAHRNLLYGMSIIPSTAESPMTAGMGSFRRISARAQSAPISALCQLKAQAGA